VTTEHGRRLRLYIAKRRHRYEQFRRTIKLALFRFHSHVVLFITYRSSRNSCKLSLAVIGLLTTVITFVQRNLNEEALPGGFPIKIIGSRNTIISFTLDVPPGHDSPHLQRTFVTFSRYFFTLSNDAQLSVI